MSCCKACLSSTPVWIGWVICLDSFTADLQDGKKARLIALLKSVYRLKTCPLVALEKLTGKLNWLSGGAFHPSLTGAFSARGSEVIRLWLDLLTVPSLARCLCFSVKPAPTLVQTLPLLAVCWPQGFVRFLMRDRRATSRSRFLEPGQPGFLARPVCQPSTLHRFLAAFGPDCPRKVVALTCLATAGRA